MLTLTEYKESIIMRDEAEGQHVRLFFHLFTEYPDEFEYAHLIELPYIAVNRLYVSPEYRRNGYARKVMDLMFRANNDIQNFMIVANPDIDNELTMDQLCAFYGTFGFVRSLDIPEGRLMLITNRSVCQI